MFQPLNYVHNFGSQTLLIQLESVLTSAFI